ncbi:PREDICTED: uncharacterized protein LOC107091067 [Cyprinodon variegatus]|uniref:uncharacterized protein LOC107091067 n=1 Tax=Cyprinodon variegatus TaxID=28743 RepID=UPI0007425B2E|nr:PREDICTED: uncharacterized protein LOC107091067 [Cyprinodon variegatus]
MRREIKSLSKQFKNAPTEEREGIKDLTSQIRDRLSRLRRAESLRKKRRDREKKRAQFIKDPFQFTRALLGEAKSGKLTSPREEVEAFLEETHSDSFRNQNLEGNPPISSVEAPKKELNINEPTWKEVQEFRLYVQEEVIPSVEENPIKCLGKWFDNSLADRNNMVNTEKQTEEWLRSIEKSGLPGKFKAWLYQHGLLPRLTWLLTVYEAPMTSVEGMERKVNKYLRKWLGIPPSFTSVGLYIRSGQLQLPLTSVVEEFKVAKCRVIMTYRDSPDDQVRHAGIVTRSGRKWGAEATVTQTESMLKIRDIIGAPCTGRQGLGTSHFQQWSKAGTRERKVMIQEEVSSLEKEGRRSKAVALSSQGAWTKWDLPKRKITWAELWRLEPFRISFLLRSVYDTLPTPANLHRLGLSESPLCKPCGEKGTMAHILSGCKIALAQGRYRWRHDKVLMTLARGFPAQSVW